MFNPTVAGAYGNYMHEPGGPNQDKIHPKIPPPQPKGKDDPGWAYGAFLLDQYTKFDKASRTLHIYYLLSTHSPYQVHVMYSQVRIPNPEYAVPLQTGFAGVLQKLVSWLLRLAGFRPLPRKPSG